MDNVVELSKKEPEEKLVLVCLRCNCQTFYAPVKGPLECSNCELVMSNNEGVEFAWFLALPAPTPDNTFQGNSEDRPDKGEGVTMHHFGNAAFAQRSVFNDIKRYHESGEMCLIMAYRNDGTGRAWYDVSNEEQREWVLRKLDQLRDHVANASLETEEGYRTSPEPQGPEL